jgi:hypothetical protein
MGKNPIMPPPAAAGAAANNAKLVATLILCSPLAQKPAAAQGTGTPSLLPGA